MKYYFIRFDYDHYCQGYEKETETLLVEAFDFEVACTLIWKKYTNARNFVNLTLRQETNNGFFNNRI